VAPTAPALVSRAARLDEDGREDQSCQVDESQRWVDFGRWLVEHREEKGLSLEEAATKAEVPEDTWRDLESGLKESFGGIKVLPNPSTDVLEKVAQCLDVPVAEVIGHAGRRPGPARPGAQTAEPEDDRTALVRKIARLNHRDRQLLDRLVEAMLEEG